MCAAGGEALDFPRCAQPVADTGRLGLTDRGRGQLPGEGCEPCALTLCPPRSQTEPVKCELGCVSY